LETERSIRLRDNDLPQELGHFSIQQSSAGDLDIFFSVGSGLTIKHNDANHIPPIEKDIKISNGDVIFFGTHIGALNLEMQITIVNNNLTLEFAKL